MTVTSVTVNGQPATFTFKSADLPGRPERPGRSRSARAPHRPDDPDQRDQPEPAGLRADDRGRRDGQPAVPGDQARDHAGRADPERHRLQGHVNYTGRPGVRATATARTEGWFRNNSPGRRRRDGHHRADRARWPGCRSTTTPSVKPTYDIYSTVNYDPATRRRNRSRSATAAWSAPSINAPDANFPTGGSRTFNWHSAEPIAAYLVENSIGHFD